MAQAVGLGGGQVPRWGPHRTGSKLVTGDEHPEVHRWIDWPFRFMGRGHRKLFHGPLSAGLVGAAAAAAHGKDPTSGAVAGVTHAAQDGLDKAIRRATPRPLRWLLPFAGRALWQLAETLASGANDGLQAAPKTPREKAEQPPGYLLPQRPPTWFLTDQGFWVAALGPALGALLLTLDTWAVRWVGSLLGGWPEPGHGFQVCALASWGTLAVAYPFGIRALRQWWGTSQPWRPVRARDGGLRRQTIAEEEWGVGDAGRWREHMAAAAGLPHS